MYSPTLVLAHLTDDLEPMQYHNTTRSQYPPLPPTLGPQFDRSVDVKPSVARSSPPKEYGTATMNTLRHHFVTPSMDPAHEQVAAKMKNPCSPRVQLGGKKRQTLTSRAHQGAWVDDHHLSQSLVHATETLLDPSASESQDAVMLAEVLLSAFRGLVRSISSAPEHHSMV